MAMARTGSSAVWVWCLVAVVAAAVLVREGEAVTCSPLELSSCIGAITSSSPPSRDCCNKLRQQRPCLCGYLQNPSLRQYVNSPRARQVAVSCSIAFPRC